MSETPHGDIVSRHPKATLLTTFTAVLEAIVQQIKDPDYRQIAVPLAPFLALLLMIIVKTIIKRDRCKNLIKLKKDWIAVLEAELANPNTSKSRLQQIEKEIAAYHAEIKKTQMDYLDIEFN